jgi:hypothetical protein
MNPPIPQHATSGGTYWPATGTIPKADASTKYVVTDIVAQKGVFLLQSRANPGVDEVDPLSHPVVASQKYVYFPTTQQLCKVDKVWALDTDRTTWAVSFAEAPTGLTARTVTLPSWVPSGAGEDVQIVTWALPYPLSVKNVGIGPATVDGTNLLAGESVNVINVPVMYDEATGKLDISRAY